MKSTNMRWALNEALKEEMVRDEKVFLAGEDIGFSGGSFGVTKDLYKQFGAWRVKDTPLSEEAIAGLAVGAAMAGYRPVIEIMFMDFITVAMDQICNQAAKSRYIYAGQVSLPLVVRTMAGVGLRAGAHHSQSLESWFVHTPGLKVVMPSTPYDAKGLLKSAIRDDNPVVFIEPKALYTKGGEIPEEEYLIPLGKADVKRLGKDATIVATGQMVAVALTAADSLADEGIDVEVIDPRTLSPLDTETILDSVRKTNHLVIVQEAPSTCGFSAEVAAMVGDKALDFLDGPIKRLSMPFMPVPFGVLEDAFLPQVDDVVATVKDILN